VLPHRYPFELVDTDRGHNDGAGGRIRVRLTADGGVHRAEPYPPVLAIEVLAQAAARLLGGDRPKAGRLAGLDGVRFLPLLADRPLQPGDVLEAAVEAGGGFGTLLKVRGELRRDGEPVVEGELILLLEEAGGEKAGG
jgi:3-hydroxymyristoyl/3-hydroxydecanoyl-(acyl carrier protein) dehydratase